MDLQSKYVLSLAGFEQAKVILEVDDHWIGRDFVAGVGLGVERRREPGKIHRLASTNLGTVQVRDKSVVVLYV